jgi:tyrosine-protein phosphatase YwqE
MNTLDVQDAHGRALDAALAGVPLQRVHAAEHYLDEAVVGAGMKGRVVPYGTSSWILLELPYQGPPPDLFGVLYSIRRQGYRVLLAHLERYPYVVDRKELVDRIVDAGHLVQVNLGSLAGGYSKEHRKAAERLVLDGYAAVLAGDCHRAGDVPKFVEKGLKVARKLLGDDVVGRLTVTNPALILEDAPPERIWPS